MLSSERRPVELREPQRPPVRLTHHEQAVWYRLAAHCDEVVSGKDLLWSGWGRGPNWDDPDEYRQKCARHLVVGVIYWLRRLLEARGGWVIETTRNEGYCLRRVEGLRLQEPEEQEAAELDLDEMDDAPEPPTAPTSTSYQTALPGVRGLIDAERELAAAGAPSGSGAGTRVT